MSEGKDNGSAPTVTGSLGLSGVWFQIANLSAVAILVGLVGLGAQEFFRQAREDRQLFREAIFGLQEGQRQQTQAIRDLGESVKRLKQ